mgnify:CR=1 FL=1
MGRILPHWRSARRARIRAQSTLPRGKVSPEAAHARRGGVPQRRRGGGDLHVRSDKCAPVRGAFFMGRIAAQVEPRDTAREKGAGQARIARNQLGSCATSCRACSLHGKDRGASGTVGYRAREGGGAGADLRAIDPAARERPRIRASFNRKNEKMEPVGTVARRVRCRFGVLIFRQCLRCGHAFSIQPRWLTLLNCAGRSAQQWPKEWR